MQRYAWSRPRERLFVYGTLRPRAGHPMGRVLAHNARALGAARMRGQVGRAGAYPVAKAGVEGGWVCGELFEVTGGRGVWRVLDRYEGCDAPRPEYECRRVTIRLAAAGCERWTTAWCYVMAEQSTGGDAAPARQPG